MTVELETIPLYKYLGLSVLLIVSVILIRKFYTIKFTLFEGLQNRRLTSNIQNLQTNISNDVTFLYDNVEKSDTELKKKNEKTKDIISIGKYKTNYENLLLSLEEYTNILLLTKVANIGENSSKLTPGSNIQENILNDMQDANTLKLFIDTLNTTMKYVDRNK